MKCICPLIISSVELGAWHVSCFCVVEMQSPNEVERAVRTDVSDANLVDNSIGERR